MKKRVLNFAGTIFSFLLWVFIAIVTLIAFSVILVISPFDRNQKISHQITVLWGKSIMEINPFWKLKISGKHHIKKNGRYVLVANHTSLADIICLYCLGVDFKWVAKESLFKIPFFGWSMSLLKYIPLERGAHGSIREAMSRAEHYLKNTASVLFFPEGTRSKTGKLSPFKNGAFKLALETGAPIIPIVISGTRQALKKGRARMSATIHGTVTVLPKIETASYAPGEFNALKNDVWNVMNEALIKN